MKKRARKRRNIGGNRQALLSRQCIKNCSKKRNLKAEAPKNNQGPKKKLGFYFAEPASIPTQGRGRGEIRKLHAREHECERTRDQENKGVTRSPKQKGNTI